MWFETLAYTPYLSIVPSLDVGIDIGGVLFKLMDNYSFYCAERDRILSLWLTLVAKLVSFGNNGASKKSIGFGPKIHLCGAMPNTLKHGGYGHRLSLQKGLGAIH